MEYFGLRTLSSNLSSNTSIFNDYGIYFASPISGGGGFQFFMATLTIPTAEILGKK